MRMLALSARSAQNLRKAQILLFYAHGARAEGDAQAGARACAQSAHASTRARTPLPATLSEQARAKRAYFTRARAKLARPAIRLDREPRAKRAKRAKFANRANPQKSALADFCCARCRRRRAGGLPERF